MKSFLLLFLILIVFPISLLAQWKRETGFTIGVVLPNHSKDYSNDEEIGFSTKLGFQQSWYKPEQKSTFRPEAGINDLNLRIGNSLSSVSLAPYRELGCY